MKSSTKKIIAAIMAAAMALPMAACNTGTDDSVSSGDVGTSADSNSEKIYSSQTLTICSWGGAIQEAQRKTIFEPFMAETGCEIIETTEPDPAKLKSMVEAGNMEIDIWDVDSDFVPRGIAADLFEPLDFNVISKDGLIEEFITEYSVPCEIATICISWNTNTYSQENHPKTWAEFFDTEKFPGKRTLYSNPMSMLEVVLMADGVNKDELYPLDVDRAFKYLDAHKEDILTFWDSGAQSVELVTSGDTVLGEVWGGRSITAKADGQPIDFDPYNAVLTGDSFIIGKGSQNVELANAFIAYATSPQVVANYAIEYPGNAPANSLAYDLMTEEQISALASSPTAAPDQVYVDLDWWYENYDAVYEKFQEWKLG